MGKIKVITYLSICIALATIFVGCGSSGSSGGGPKAPVREFTSDGNTVALWHFNESSGSQTLLDSSVNGRNLIMGANTTDTVPDPELVTSGRTGFGNCLSFDATDKYGYRSENGTLTDFSVEYWVKSTTKNNPTILDLGCVVLGYDAGGKPSFSVLRQGGTWEVLYSITVIADGNWHYLCVTCDQGAMKIYIDGIPKENVLITGTQNPNYSQWYLGGRPGVARFNGLIDEFRISNKARTAAEISTYYTQATQ